MSLLERHKVPLAPDAVAFVVVQVAESSRLAAACHAAGVIIGDGAAGQSGHRSALPYPPGRWPMRWRALDAALRCEGTIDDEQTPCTRPDCHALTSCAVAAETGRNCAMR